MKRKAVSSLSQNQGFMPVPESNTDCVVPGWLRELSVTVAAPETGPAAVGVKVMGRAAAEAGSEVARRGCNRRGRCQ
jgi:hypothetical protein